MAHVSGSVLIVEDDPFNRTVLATCLQEEGHIVRTAENGRQALGMLHEEGFDLVLLDLLMPEMNGYEVLEWIKTDPGLRNLPVVVVSAEEDMKNIARCIEMGATDYLPKPCEPALLRARVRASLAMKRLYEREAYHGKILVVDDDPLNRTILSVNLQEQGYEVVTMENGDDALRILYEQPFDVLLLDLLMPDLDGFDVLSIIKADARIRHLPVLIISGEQDLASVTRCIVAGAEDYMQKPFDPVLLRARVSACVEKKKLRDQEIRQQMELHELNKALEVRNRFIREIFGRYLSDAVVDTILASPQGLALGGEKRTVTILIADLRGFSSVSDILPADSVVNMINLYLDAMTDIILRYSGTVYDFIGDAILAIFGTPLSRDDDAVRAVACAIEMQLSMKQVNKQYRAAGYPEVTMGIGINTGEVVVGNVGSARRTKYGPIGRNVNMASRIESYTVGGDVLISESTLKACGPIIETRKEIEVMPKGFKQPIILYEVGGIGGDFRKFVATTESDTLTELKTPLCIGFSEIEEKHVHKILMRGLITGAEGDLLDIRSDAPVTVHADLKLVFLDDTGQQFGGEFYGKVTASRLVPAPTFRVHVSFISQEAKRIIETCL